MSRFLKISPEIRKAHMEGIIKRWEEAGFLEGLKTSEVLDIFEQESSALLNASEIDTLEHRIKNLECGVNSALDSDWTKVAKTRLYRLITALTERIKLKHCG